MPDIQKMINNHFEETGDLWKRDKILLKITEELGELAKAFRKQTRKEQKEEFGDLIFAVHALAQCEGFSIFETISYTMSKHRTSLRKRKVKTCGPTKK